MPAALDSLSHLVARLGGLVETQVNDAVNACVRRDTALAQAVIDRDARSDVGQKDADKLATAILVTGPNAEQVRAVVMALKIAAELERVGDLAKSMSKRTLVLNQSEPIPLTRGIERMGRIASELLKHALDAYSQRDLSRAVAVWNRDEELDAYYNTLFRELLSVMVAHPRTVASCTHLLFVAKNLERVGDHCTNISEAVHMLITGADIASERPKANAIERWLDPTQETEAETPS